jgi:hypothetical protein
MERAQAGFAGLRSVEKRSGTPQKPSIVSIFFSWLVVVSHELNREFGNESKRAACEFGRGFVCVRLGLF